MVGGRTIFDGGGTKKEQVFYKVQHVFFAPIDLFDFLDFSVFYKFFFIKYNLKIFSVRGPGEKKSLKAKLV